MVVSIWPTEDAGMRRVTCIIRMCGPRGCTISREQDAVTEGEPGPEGGGEANRAEAQG